MAMIQGIDGGALINMFRQGREDRYQSDARKLTMAAEQRKAQDDAEYKGLAGQLYRPRGGVAGNYAPQQPASPPSFDQAFGGDTQAALDTPGAALPALPGQAPPAPSADQGQMEVDPVILKRMILLRPEQTGQMVNAFSKMSDDEAKQHADKSAAMGSAAAALEQYPEGSPERAQKYQELVVPFLLEHGWKPNELSHPDLTNHGLIAYQALARDTHTIAADRLARDEFNAGKTVAEVPGGGVATVRPTYDATGNVNGTTASHLITPYQAATAPPATNVPPAAADYLKAHPDLKAQFDAKYGAGASDSILGGGASNGTGGFPSV